MKPIGWTKVMDREILSNLDHQPQGPKHLPIPHLYAINFFEGQLKLNDIEIKNTKILLSPDTYKMIYLADVVPADLPENKEFNFQVGFINNNDRTIAFTGLAGTHIYANGAEFHVSENSFKTRHVTSVYDLLSDRVNSIMIWFKEYYHMQLGNIEKMKVIKVDDDMLGGLILDYIRAKYVLSSTNIKNIVKEFDRPKHKNFSDKSLWSLRNTTNEVFSKIKSPMFRLDAMNLFDKHFKNMIEDTVQVDVKKDSVVVA